jgi:hypothetical protein
MKEDKMQRKKDKVQKNGNGQMEERRRIGRRWNRRKGRRKTRRKRSMLWILYNL